MDDDWAGGHSLAGESDGDRSERQLNELLTEVRVAMPGVQVLFAFLLAVPFQTRFKEVTDAERALYVATLLTSGIASACFISLAATHRLLFRHRQREFIIRTGNRFMLLGLAALAAAMSCATALVISFVYSAAAGWVALGAAALLFSMLWFVLPLARLHRRARER